MLACILSGNRIAESDTTKMQRGCLQPSTTFSSKKPPYLAFIVRLDKATKSFLKFYKNCYYSLALLIILGCFQLGCHRLFQFIKGANLNYSRVAMTSPVVTSLVPEAGPLHSSAYVVRFCLPALFQDKPPTPLPELNLEPYRWETHYVAIRKFLGFATDDNVLKEAVKLATSLSLSLWANSTTATNYAYSIAQYDPPFRFIGRVNEVWVDIDASHFVGYIGKLMF